MSTQIDTYWRRWIGIWRDNRGLQSMIGLGDFLATPELWLNEWMRVGELPLRDEPCLPLLPKQVAIAERLDNELMRMGCDLSNGQWREHWTHRRYVKASRKRCF